MTQNTHNHIFTKTVYSLEEKNKLRLSIANALIRIYIVNVIVSGIIDLYTYRAIKKAGNSGIYRQKLKMLLNRLRKNATVYLSAQRGIEKNIITRLVCADLPSMTQTYTNSGMVTMKLQSQWMKKYGKAATDLYMSYYRGLSAHNVQNADFFACMMVINILALMATEYTETVEKEIGAGRNTIYRQSLQCSYTIGCIAVNILAFITEKENKEYMKTKLFSDTQDLSNAVFLYDNADMVSSAVLACVMDYTEFYIASIVHDIQCEKFSINTATSVEKDMCSFIDRGEEVCDSFLAECRLLAGNLPLYEDIDDLKDAISVSGSIVLTPTIDAIRRHAVELRLEGIDEDTVKSIKNEM